MNRNLMESHYTIELRYLLADENFKLFDFDYDFYEPQFRHEFEQKFISHYYFNEIGCESVLRFKQRLRNRLNLKMRYYSQLYQTELASKGITWLYNKDLTETFVREVQIDGEENQKGNTSSKSKSNDNLNASNKSNTDFKESSIENGNATLSDDSLTTINKTGDSSSVNQTMDNNSSADIDTASNNVSKESQKESTTLVSRGNIGITSSAELLEKWREVLINIDEMIIEECRDLFMLIY